MSIQEKKFKKLFKQLTYEQSELDYVREVLKDAHHEFEEYYRRYCSNKEIDIPALEKKNPKKVEALNTSQQAHDDKGDLIPTVQTIDHDDLKQFKKIYREIAKKIHPDKFSNLEKTPEIIAKELLFKEATKAMAEKNWGKILDIADKLVILLDDYKELNRILKKEIIKVKEKVAKEKSTYSWTFFECEENSICKNNVIKKFLHHMFNYREEK